MKRILQLSAAFAILAASTLVACKKDPTTPNNNTPQATACDGKKLCFKLDGAQESYDDVVWRKIPANGSTPERYRILWETGSGTAYKNIEIDVYATATGTYNIKAGTPYAANDAAFQYYIANPAKNMVGQTGTVTISAIDNTNNTISGSFKVTAMDNGTNYEITEGNFVNVPLK